MSIVGPSLVSLVFVMIGWAIIYFARTVTAKARQSLSWPSTAGVIAHSAVLVQTQRTSATNDTATYGTTYTADVFYRYRIQGTDYSSTRITLMDFSSTSSRAEGVVSRYPHNAKVVVRYNPADPSEAVLEPGECSGLTLLYVVGGAFFAAGLFFLVMSLTGHVHMRH